MAYFDEILGVADSVKYDSLVFVDQDTVFEMSRNGCREGEFFHVAPFADEIAHRVAVSDVGNGLVDNRPLIEIGCRVVRGCSDQFDATLVRLVVGFGSGESRQEGVVDIYYRFSDSI